MKSSYKAVDHPKIVLLGTFCIIIAGILCLSLLPVELTPKVDIPVLFVVVPYPGAAPDDVESQITHDLEKKLNTLRSLNKIRSISAEGYSSIILELHEGTKIQEAKRDIRELVDEAKVDFPEDAEEAIIKNIDFSNIPLLFVTLHGQESPEVLKELAENFRDVLESVSGVSEIDLFGGIEREIHVDVNLDQLKSYLLSLGQIENALREQNINYPGGYLEVGEQEFLIRSVGEFLTLEDIENTVIQNQANQVVLLKHIAKISDTNKKVDTIARINGEPGVTLIIQRELGINTLETVTLLRERIKELSQQLPRHIQVSISFDQSEEIRDMIEQLGSTVIYAAILVSICLMLVMGIRNALLVCIAVPISLLFGFICFQLAGINISGITLFSLILIMGMVVDGAIIVSENIFRHIENGLDGKSAAKLGIYEVGEAVIAADLTTVAAFFPMIFIVGVMGQFLSVMPKVVAFTLLGSMIVDHYILPVLSSLLMKKSPPKKKHFYSWPLEASKRLHSFTLRFCLRHPWLTIACCCFLLAIAFAMAGLGFLGYEFMPSIDRGRFSVNIELPRGTSIFKTNEVAQELENLVKRLPKEEVESYVTTIGQTNKLNADILEGGGSGPEFAKITVKLIDHRYRKRTLPEILEEYRSFLDQKFPGVQINFHVQKDGPPVGAAIAVRIQGDQLNAINEVSIRLQEVLKKCLGAIDIQADYRANAPQIQIQIDRVKAGAYGVSARQISAEISRAFLGKEVGKITLKSERIDIRLQLEKKFRTTKEFVEKLYITLPSGEQIPVAQVAQVNEIFGPASINHYKLKRTITVRCETANNWSSDDISLWLKQELKTFYLPQEIAIEVGGETEERDKSMGSTRSVMGISVILILLILTAQFNSFSQPLLIAATVPLSFIGVIFGLYLLDQRFGFMPFIGIVSLTGIVVNDAIVLVDFINRLQHAGLPRNEAIIRGAERRLRPIMLTSITTVGGLIPLAMNWGGGGLFWAPLCWTIISGITFATLLTLVVIPVLYSLLIPEQNNETETPLDFESLLRKSQLQELGLSDSISSKPFQLQHSKPQPVVQETQKKSSVSFP